MGKRLREGPGCELIRSGQLWRSNCSPAASRSPRLVASLGPSASAEVALALGFDEGQMAGIGWAPRPGQLRDLFLPIRDLTIISHIELPDA